jgi:uncharacterized DUF497 family protein
MALKFSWDAKKAVSNLAKHGISFAEASTVFGDSLSIAVRDEQHSLDEERFFIIGRSQAGAMIVVWYAEYDDTIRIISARKPTATEAKKYEEGYER